LVNPYDPEGVGIAINRALSMPLIERRQRQEHNYTVLMKNDITHWAERFLAMLELPWTHGAESDAPAAAGRSKALI
jgi:trehalose 6-phosphate synthase